MAGTASLEDLRVALGGSRSERAEAFTCLLGQSLDRHFRLAAVILRNRDDAEDALGEAALRAWQHVAALHEPAKFEAWFSRILVNVCRDRLRGRPGPLPLVAEPASSSDPFTESVERDALFDALGELTPEHRAVIALHYLEGLTVDQIAFQLGMRAGTVKSRLHYGLSELRAAYEAASRDPRRTVR